MFSGVDARTTELCAWRSRLRGKSVRLHSFAQHRAARRSPAAPRSYALPGARCVGTGASGKVRACIELKSFAPVIIFGRGLTLRCTGKPTAAFSGCGFPVNSNVRPHIETLDSIRIEPYQPRHARPLVELWRASFEHGVGIADPHPLEEQLAFFEAKVHPENTVRIALSAFTLVGFIASTPESIAQIYVGVPFIGRGIGSQMLSLAKSESSGSLWLHTFACNARARAFYERHGFKDSGHGYENMWNLEDIKYIWSRSLSAA